MDIRRVALIFDSVLRPETAGVYCHRALERLVEVEHFQPHELDRVPRQGFDLYLNIDDGLRYHLPPELRPCAFWAIDTHLDFDRCREKAPRFDVVFAAQRDGVEMLRGIGVSSASWLPLACDAEIHRKHDLAKQYDVALPAMPLCITMGVERSLVAVSTPGRSCARTSADFGRSGRGMEWGFMRSTGRMGEPLTRPLADLSHKGRGGSQWRPARGQGRLRWTWRRAGGCGFGSTWRGRSCRFA